MNLRIRLSIAVALLVVLFVAGCAEPRKHAQITSAKGVRGPFASYGRVSLHPGQPCASQIMFDFRGAGPTIWLAAPMRESRVLTGAANCNCPVHVVGIWRRGQEPRCNYVEVTRAELMK